MSEIKAGDMVMVVKACCDIAAGRWMGRVFTSLGVVSWGAECLACGMQHDEPSIGSPFVNTIGTLAGFPESWLKKIDPPSEILLEEQEKELTT